jgi:2'-5' RNA ligase
VRLFCAIWPPERVVAHLNKTFNSVALPPTLRPTPPRRWHITLCFYGNGGDPDERAAFLEQQLANLPAPRLRLAGSGTFPGVLWVGVRPVSAADREVMRRLATASGAGHRFQAHVSIARWRLDLPSPVPAMHEQLAAYRGPVWIPPEVSLVRSEQSHGGPTYTTVHTVTLAGPTQL